MARNLFYIILLFLTSCAAKKEMAEFETQPDWVKIKPSVSGYFIGVGSAKKVGLPATYAEQARRDALADMASEVAVNVSSTSVLHSIETEYGFVDSYDQRVEISTDDYLEGFEPVDHYENETTYWTYFRIAKKTYFENKAKNKARSIALALSNWEAGNAALEQNRPSHAISSYLKGLDAIKQYLSEETKTEYRGGEIDIGTTLYAALSEVVSSFSIQSDTSLLQVKRGYKLPYPVKFTVRSYNKPVSDVPVVFAYSGGYLKGNTGISDALGNVKVDPGIINAIGDEVDLSAKIDLRELANKATDDFFIRGLLINKRAADETVIIKIIPPGLCLILDEENCAETECEQIKASFLRNAQLAGFDQVPSEEADYLFKLGFQLKEGARAGGLQSVYFSGKLESFDHKGKIIWSKEIKDIEGVAKTLQEARSQSFKEFLKNLNLLYFKEGIDRLTRIHNSY